MGISLRLANTADLKTINERYAEVDFVPSHEDELIVLASIDEKIVGQGRVVSIDSNIGELGGIYVFPNNEGLGVARKVVDFLIKNSKHPLLYCLPFAELEDFYGSMGFAPVEDMAQVPKAVIGKYKWCNSNYDKAVLLLQRIK